MTELSLQAIATTSPTIAAPVPSELFIEAPRNLTTETRETVSRAIRRAFHPFIAYWCELFITWVSGCPHYGQRPLFRRGPRLATAEAFVGFFLSIAAAHVAVTRGFWWTLPIIWLFIVGRTWSLFAIFHHATHGNLFRSEAANRRIANTISLLTFATWFDAYRETHIRSHHAAAFCRLDDAEGAFIELDFPPGRTREAYWRHLWWSVVMPGSYFRYARCRLWDWHMGSPRTLLLTWTFALSLLAVAWYASAMTSLLLAYVVPLFVIFNVTGLVGTFSEHYWGCLRDNGSPRERKVLLSQGRYLLDEAPEPSLPPARRYRLWVVWWLRLLFYHLPTRIAILPADSLHHDHHHRHPQTEDWANSSYERAQHIWNGCPGFPDHPHIHAWSLGEAIDRVFTHMAAAPPPGEALADGDGWHVAQNFPQPERN